MNARYNTVFLPKLPEVDMDRCIVLFVAAFLYHLGQITYRKNGWFFFNLHLCNDESRKLF